MAFWYMKCCRSFKSTGREQPMMCTHTAGNSHDACAHSWTLTSPVTPSTREGQKLLATTFFSSLGCIYTKVAMFTSSMNLCFWYHVTWTVLHTWLHYSISIKTMHFEHCLYTREVRCINHSTWIGCIEGFHDTVRTLLRRLWRPWRPCWIFFCVV